MSVLIGTYTTGKKDTGLYKAADVSLPGTTFIATPDASWVTYGADGTVLYAVQESPGGSGAVASFARLPDGGYAETARMDCGGVAPCHLALCEKEQLLFCANYTSGSLAVFALNPDGSLACRTALVQHAPRPALLPGCDAVRQAGPHLHFAAPGPLPRLCGQNAGCENTAVQTDPPHRALWTVDLGLDVVRLYTINQTPCCIGEYRLPAGFGPRHLVFHPTLPLAYLAGELSSLVAVIPTDCWQQSEVPLQTLHTLPCPGKTNYPSAIRIRADGKKLYVANRGDNSVSVFDIDAAGRLTLAGCHTTGGNWPRDILLQPDKIVIANQLAGGVTALPLTSEGLVCGAAVPLPGPETPVCLLQTDFPL